MFWKATYHFWLVSLMFIFLWLKKQLIMPYIKMNCHENYFCIIELQCSFHGLGISNIKLWSLFYSTNQLYMVNYSSQLPVFHYDDVTMGVIASLITSLTIVYSTIYSDADQRKHQSSASLAFVWGIHRWPVNSPHTWPVMQKMFPFDDIIMWCI